MLYDIKNIKIYKIISLWCVIFAFFSQSNLEIALIVSIAANMLLAYLTDSELIKRTLAASIMIFFISIAKWDNAIIFLARYIQCIIFINIEILYTRIEKNKNQENNMFFSILRFIKITFNRILLCVPVICIMIYGYKDDQTVLLMDISKNYIVSIFMMLTLLDFIILVVKNNENYNKVEKCIKEMIISFR